MNLESQVTSLALAKRLKELGVKQDSYFIWLDIGDDENAFSIYAYTHRPIYHPQEIYSAFTVAELGEMLPFSFTVADGEWRSYYDLVIDKNVDGWHLRYEEDGSSPYPMITEKTEADARAKMLIYLIEKGLVKLG